MSPLLLALWYREVEETLWWVKQRAEIEGIAIPIYLERFHYDTHEIFRLLA